MITILLLAGGAFLVLGAELLVRGAVAMAVQLRISPLVVGLTIVAFGTSAPEAAVSISSAATGRTDVAVGNVVGSNIFNVLFILGVAALITPLVVAQRVVKLDVPIMIAASVLVLLLAWNGGISRLEGWGMLFLLAVHTVWCIVGSRHESAEVVAEYSQEEGRLNPAPVASPGASGRVSLRIARQILLIVVGLGMLVLGSNWFVDGATQLAQIAGVSELVIGLTVVAAGTSLPEVATSVVAALRGQRDVAVGNVVGSNLFNALGILGASAAVSSNGIDVPTSAIQIDIPVMIGAAAACLPVFWTGGTIRRWEGALFLGCYIAYTTFLILWSTSAPPASNAALPTSTVCADAVETRFHHENSESGSPIAQHRSVQTAFPSLSSLRRCVESPPVGRRGAGGPI